MPRNVRNFWVELNVDGRTEIAAGPRSKDGGFRLVVRVREDGAISEKHLVITGRALSDGTLEVAADLFAPNGDAVQKGSEQGPLILRTTRDAAPREVPGSAHERAMIEAIRRRNA